MIGTRVLTRSRWGDVLWIVTLWVTIFLMVLKVAFPSRVPPLHASVGACPALLLIAIGVERFVILTRHWRHFGIGKRAGDDGPDPLADLAMGVLVIAFAAFWGRGVLFPPESPPFDSYGLSFGVATQVLGVTHYFFAGPRFPHLGHPPDGLAPEEKFQWYWDRLPVEGQDELLRAVTRQMQELYEELRRRKAEVGCLSEADEEALGTLAEFFDDGER